jgi:solute carrier family 50 protein (sugar transporter)
MSVALSVFSILTVVTSIILRVSPFPDYYHIIKHKTPGEVQLLPVVALFVNGATQVMYACVIDDYVPLFVTNVFGVCTAIGFVIIFHTYAPDRIYVYKMCGYGLVIVVIILLYTILTSTGVTGQTNGSESTVLGWLMVFTTVAQFGSPLATMKRVIMTKSNASLPFFMCCMNVVNCACWIGYSSLQWNAFIWGPSLAGAIMGVVQVVLWVVYRQPNAAKTEVTSDEQINGMVAGDLVVIEMSGSQCNNQERSSTHGSSDDSVFIEVVTPRQQES